jgi:hypothetical protein
VDYLGVLLLGHHEVGQSESYVVSLLALACSGRVFVLCQLLLERFDILERRSLRRLNFGTAVVVSILRVGGKGA